MRLNRPFLRLPIKVDADALAHEVEALSSSAWTSHPSGYRGNEAVRLITPNGQPSDAILGPMAPTQYLLRCHYVRQIMAGIGAVWGRSRLMALAPGSQVPTHIDLNYYWRTHFRIHIPIVTNPAVLFTCGDETVHMAAGECWIFDSFRWHDVKNGGEERRVHLVLDTVGGGILPDLMRAAADGEHHPTFLPVGEESGEDLLYERVNSPKVMSPWEMRCHLAFIREHAGSDRNVLRALECVERFIDSWTAAWARFGSDDDGLPAYLQLLQEVRRSVFGLGVGALRLPSEVSLARLLEEQLFSVAVAMQDTKVRPVGEATPEPLRQRTSLGFNPAYMKHWYGRSISTRSPPSEMTFGNVTRD